jgi:hypothetical protein
MCNHQQPYSEHIVFFVTYKWTLQAKSLHFSRLDRLAMDKRSGLLGPFVHYEENKVLCNVNTGLGYLGGISC